MRIRTIDSLFTRQCAPRQPEAAFSRWSRWMNCVLTRPPRHNFNRCHECTTDDLRIDLDKVLNARRKRIHRVELVQSIAPMSLTLGNPPLAANLRSDVGLISCIVRESGLPARHVDDSVPRSWGWWNSGWTGTALIGLPAPF